MLASDPCDRLYAAETTKANQWYGRLARYRANKYIVVRELWKTVAVPSTMYGMNIISWNEGDMQKFEVIQSKLSRVALGASGYAAVETLRGDMGWSTFSEKCMKGCIGYKIRIKRMSNKRWVKKAYMIMWVLEASG